MPGVSQSFSKTFLHPDGSKSRSGFDLYALQYFSEALDFKFKLVYLVLMLLQGDSGGLGVRLD